MSSPTLLIIGAGISGLTLAQACRKNGIAYQIFERDASAEDRSAGWGLTIHFGLPTFKTLLPDDIVARFPETFVNKEAYDSGEKGSFTYFDLTTAKAEFNIPPAERIRVYRKKLRNLLLTDIDVQWSKSLTSIDETSDGVKVGFSDGSSYSGTLVVGTDGVNSAVRRLSYPEEFKNDPLPIRFIGTGVHYTHKQIAGIRKLDPYFLHGSDPTTDVYMWFSFLETPSDGMPPDTYHCQIMISWPFRDDFLGHSKGLDMPSTSAERLALIKSWAEKWAEPFKSIVLEIPEGNDMKPVQLQDWLPRAMHTHSGKVVLLGDAAHTMVMYRGEGANQSIIDAGQLMDVLRPIFKSGHSNEELKEATSRYEQEMITRTTVAVAASRQACLDAHDFKSINSDSPLVKRKLVMADLKRAKIAV